MKYLATIKYSSTDSESQSFDTVEAAEEWLDGLNAGFKHTTVISEVNDNWETQDWFYYTEGPVK